VFIVSGTSDLNAAPPSEAATSGVAAFRASRRRRNLLTLVLLVSFVAAVFLLGIFHVVLELPAS